MTARDRSREVIPRRAAHELVAAGAQLAAAGLILPGEGNLSVRSDGGRCVITPTGVDKGRLTSARLLLLPLDGSPPPVGASIESRLHVEVYRRFPQVAAVVHAHPLHVQALAMSSRLPDCTLLMEGTELLGTVGWTGCYEPGSGELALAVADALATSRACVLYRHGAVTVGSTMSRAVRRMMLLERLAILTLAAVR